MIGSMVTSIISFISTNIDDIFVLMILYSQVNDKMKKSYIVTGQYLGISILVMLSLLGAFGLLILPEKYVGILGIIPIILGIKAWFDSKKEIQELHTKNYSFIEEDIDNNGIYGKREKETHFNKIEKIKSFLGKIIKPEILSVMLITIANGADNIGIYIPLFRSYTFGQLIITIIIFSVMIALWCFLGEKISSFPQVKEILQKYKRIIIPIVFIGLGIFIIIESGLFF
ncbi:cadmium resistance transporter [Tissierella pigra]|uniref:cadmium resistance transporter n=1 Tax=Tissierella pigra TaxID=2607614 RepID=UPI001C118937|nr:cadmium resistance transporter [Tissierella pigra]MBU5426786.1 cadmium resistance transporter [Tissierella pigra]